MDVEFLLRDCMKKKPASRRGARQKTSTPKDVIRMNYNENPYGMSESVKKAIYDATVGSYMYQDFFGVDLRREIADFHHLSEDHILIGSGSSASIDMIGEVFLNEGDEVVYGDPSYEAFPDMISDNGGVRVPVPLTSDYKFDLDAMRKAITDKTKIVVIVNPNNPTGTCLHAKEVEEFIRSLPPTIIPVVDEAYIEYVDYEDHYSMIKLLQEGYDRPLIVLRTFSKIYGLAGLRIGYAAAAPEVIDQLMKACQAWNVGRNAQIAAYAALKDQAYVRKMFAINREAREYLEESLKDLGCRVVPTEANFIYFQVPGRDSKEVKAYLADHKVQIGAPDAFNRVTVGTKEQNEVFLTLMREIVKRQRAIA